MESSVTQLLADWRDGNDAALESLTPLVYDELRKMAARRMARERPDHTLQATALVHEAFVKLTEADVAPVDRAHFLALAARMMRRILVDHARAKQSEKRGGGIAPLPLDEGRVAAESPGALLDLDAAIDKLSALDRKLADVIVLHYYGGLTYDEVAAVRGISAATVDRQLRLAKAWILRELGND